MSTLGPHVEAVLPRPVPNARPAFGSYPFFVRMAWVCAAIAWLGFAPTYWVPLASGRFAAAPVVHLHAALFFGWTLLFAAQATLASRGRFEGHRAFGFAGIALATAMVFAGLMASVSTIEAAIARGQGDAARAFAIVPVTMVLSFAVLVAAAVANVRRPEVHMRLMLVAAVTILPPAIARGMFALFAPEGAALRGGSLPVVASLVPNGLADLLLLWALGHDWRVRGRPHRAYVMAIGFVVAVQVGRVPLAWTAGWLAVTEWLRHFVGFAAP